MAMSEEERRRITEIIGRAYVEGYSKEMSRVASAHGLEQYIPKASAKMRGSLSVRLGLVEQAVQSYIDQLGKKLLELRASGLSETQVLAETQAWIQRMADDKAQMISQLEFAQGRFDSAGHIVTESGEAFEWRFAHFETGRAGHIECHICRKIRSKAPYTTDQAEALGYPAVPHANCDHGWVLVPVGERTLTEEFPEAPAPARAG